MSRSINVRVTVLETWDEVPLTLPSDTPITELKTRALAEAGVAADPSQFIVKLGGALVEESGATLDSVGVPLNAALIVLRRRRSPVR